MVPLEVWIASTVLSMVLCAITPCVQRVSHTGSASKGYDAGHTQQTAFAHLLTELV